MGSMAGNVIANTVQSAIANGNANKTGNASTDFSKYITPTPFVPTQQQMFPTLNTGLLANQPTSAMPINYGIPNTPLKNYTNSYQPTPWQGPSEMYKAGSILSQTTNPIFRWAGNDMMSVNPVANWTVTSTTNTQGK